MRISSNDFTLLAQGLPPDSFCLFFFGDQRTQTPNGSNTTDGLSVEFRD